jgi:hypothetical protein
MQPSNRNRTRGTDILSFLPLLFRSVDAEKLTSAAPLFLNRAVHRGDIRRLMKGYYVNSWKSRITGKAPSIEEIACFLRRPSYISCEWALNAQSVIDQAPTVCSVITLAPSVGKRNRVELDGTTLEYSRIKAELFWGYNFANNANLAAPEKALLDILYLRRRLSMADEINWEFVDPQKLTQFALRYPPFVQAALRPLLEKGRPR